MSTQHTPGPWHIHPESQSSHRWVIAQSDGSSVADCSPCGPWVSRDEADANARLIAAAPELLAGVCHAESWISDMPHGENCFLSDCYDGDPGNQCNCGKESLLASLQEVIAKAVQP